MKLHIQNCTHILYFSATLVGVMLQGCVSRPGPVQIQKVDIPIAVSCASPDVYKPSWSEDSLPASATYGQRVQAVFEDMQKARAYIGELEAELSGCK